LGHNVGDQLLIVVSNRLKNELREEDTVGRFGGDEFVVILPELGDDKIESTHLAQRVAEKLQRSISQPFQLDNHHYHLTVTIGIVSTPLQANTPEEALRNADTAMYKAKVSGRNTIRHFQAEMQQEADQRLLLEKSLHTALENDEFELYFQPQNLADGKIIGAEALIRWIHPEKGIISPADFIPVAEASGLLIEIGDWVLHTACRQIRQWQDSELLDEVDHIAVNISPSQFHSHLFESRLLQLISENQIDPGGLVIEFTEATVIGNVQEAINRMNILKKKGLRFAIDDFGTGYSSLSYMNQLPFDQLKIDRSFISNCSPNIEAHAIVKAISTMAHDLGRQVIAEGVESEEQLRCLQKLGCHNFQGYLFSRPLPAVEFSGLLQKQKAAHRSQNTSDVS